MIASHDQHHRKPIRTGPAWFPASNTATNDDTSFHGGNTATAGPGDPELDEQQRALAAMKQRHAERCRTAFRRPPQERREPRAEPRKAIVPEARVAARRRSGPRG